MLLRMTAGFSFGWCLAATFVGNVTFIDYVMAFVFGLSMVTWYLNQKA